MGVKFRDRGYGIPLVVLRSVIVAVMGMGPKRSRRNKAALVSRIQGLVNSAYKIMGFGNLMFFKHIRMIGSLPHDDTGMVVHLPHKFWIPFKIDVPGCALPDKTRGLPDQV